MVSAFFPSLLFCLLPAFTILVESEAFTINLCSSRWASSVRTPMTTKSNRGVPRHLAASTDDTKDGDDIDIDELIAESRGKKPGLDSSMRTKLIAESIAPWRTFRLFLYGSLGSGATVGGLITLTGLAAALSGARSDIDISGTYKDLAIDFGFAILFVVFAKLDVDKGNELNEQVEGKIKKKIESRKASKSIQSRETTLGSLKVSIKVTEDGVEKEGTIDDIRVGAAQNFVIVAGSKMVVRDALLGAQLLKGAYFARGNVLIVPYVTGEAVSTGFKTRTEENQPYVAQAVGDGWDAYIEAEFSDAAVQSGGNNVREEGIAIVLAKTGEVVRRGVGAIPWRKTIDELSDKLATSKK